MNFCHDDFFIFASSADPDEMPHYAAFHLGLHCLPKYLFAGIQNEKGIKKITVVVSQKHQNTYRNILAVYLHSLSFMDSKFLYLC